MIGNFLGAKRFELYRLLPAKTVCYLVVPIVSDIRKFLLCIWFFHEQVCCCRNRTTLLVSGTLC